MRRVVIVTTARDPSGGSNSALPSGFCRSLGRSSKTPASGGVSGSRRAGNSTTSRIECTPARTISNRSIPSPRPPVGGMPCSSARRKSSSKGCASSSPAACRRCCCSKRARCSSGSFSSLNAFATSIPPMNPSKRSTRPGCERCGFANGDSSIGVVEQERGLHERRLDALRQQLVDELAPSRSRLRGSPRCRPRASRRAARPARCARRCRCLSHPGSHPAASPAATAA